MDDLLNLFRNYYGLSTWLSLLKFENNDHFPLEIGSRIVMLR